MSKLQRRIGRERQTLVDARDVLGRRKNERTEELDRYLALEHERQTSLRETRRSAREALDRKSTRLNSSHLVISYAVFCLKKKSTRLNSTHVVSSYAVFCLKNKKTPLAVNNAAHHNEHVSSTEADAKRPVTNESSVSWRCA